MINASVQQRMEGLGSVRDRAEIVKTLALFMTELEKGSIRAAERDADGIWRPNSWVKEGILAAFRHGVLAEFASGALSFVDKDTLPPRRFRINDGIRVVPGGSSVRRGAFVAEGVVVMPPAYINVGAWVDEGSMVDSHALVGSCAQVGKRVHLSAAAQIGGVLEPIGMLPVIIEDDVVIGGNAGVYEGTIVRSRAVIGAGVVITGSTPVYDAIREQVYRRTAERPLEIPYGAVVVAGARRMKGDFAQEENLSLYTPVIVKYRDDKTDSATALEDALR